MTIWKNKKELPDFDREFLEVYKDNSKNIEEFMSENKARKYYLSTPDAIMPSFTVYRELDDDVVKWCYLGDLLALEQQNERLYQNQMSIVETNNVLIKRLQEQQATIDNLREIIRKKDEALNTLKDDITWLISGGLNSSGGISIEKGQANRMYETAQQALKEIEV